MGGEIKTTGITPKGQHEGSKSVLRFAFDWL